MRTKILLSSKMDFHVKGTNSHHQVQTCENCLPQSLKKCACEILTELVVSFKYIVTGRANES